MNARCALGLTVRSITIQGAQVQIVPGDSAEVLACFAHPMSLSVLRALRDRSPKPAAIIALDRAFEGRDADKANIALELRDRDISFHTV